MAKDNMIRVRIKGTQPRNGEIKKFKPMDELPLPGTPIGNGECYGGATKLTMSIYQNARDEDMLPLYDFYEVDILDSRLLKYGVDYICIPHAPDTAIQISLYDELLKLVQKIDNEEEFVTTALESGLWEKYDINKNGNLSKSGRLPSCLWVVLTCILQTSRPDFILDCSHLLV